MDVKVDPTDGLPIEKNIGDGVLAVRHARCFGKGMSRTSRHPRFPTTSSLTAAPPATAIWSLPLAPRPLAGERACFLFPRIRLRAAMSARPLLFRVPETVAANCLLTFVLHGCAERNSWIGGAATGLSMASKDITYGTDDAPKFMAFNKWARANQGSSRSF